MDLPPWLIGVAAPWLTALLITVLHVILPGQWVEGYVRSDTGRPLHYRLNGLRVLGAVLGLWLLGGATGLVPLDFFWQHRWEGVLGSSLLGLLVTVAMVAGAPSTGDAPVFDLFLGRRENPRLGAGRVDAKMWLYLVGAVQLELNLLSFGAHHVARFGAESSPGLLLGVGLLTWFVVDYLWFEKVHLWTYDLFAERVGFKLAWGCLAFYPWFYAVPIWAAVDQADPGTGGLVLEGAGLLFLVGWTFARGANLQKFHFKNDPEKVFLGMEPESIEGGGRRLLVSGLWGWARHLNYLGELLMASGIALATGAAGLPWAWLYPVYYVLLLFPRQRDDDRRCREKYGALWEEYERRVPWRIIPGLY